MGPLAIDSSGPSLAILHSKIDIVLLSLFLLPLLGIIGKNKRRKRKGNEGRKHLQNCYVHGYPWELFGNLGGCFAVTMIGDATGISGQRPQIRDICSMQDSSPS